MPALAMPSRASSPPSASVAAAEILTDADEDRIELPIVVRVPAVTAVAPA